MILRGVPFIKSWLLPVILWAIAVSIGIIFDTAEQFKLAVANGIIQGSVATLACLLYWEGIKKLMVNELKKPPSEE